MKNINKLERRLDNLGSRTPATFIVLKTDHLEGNPPEITQVQECRNGNFCRYISAEEYQKIVTDKDTIVNLIDNLECSV